MLHPHLSARRCLFTSNKTSEVILLNYKGGKHLTKSNFHITKDHKCIQSKFTGVYK